MRQQWKCLSCNGIYFDASAEGGTYHHTCPPLPDDATDKQRKAYMVRNENVAPARAGRPVEIVAEGKGVECLTSQKLDEPAWIAALNKLAAKEDEK